MFILLDEDQTWSSTYSYSTATPMQAWLWWSAGADPVEWATRYFTIYSVSSSKPQSPSLLSLLSSFLFILIKETGLGDQ